MKNIITVAFFLLVQLTYAQHGLEYPFKISKVLIDGENILNIDDEVSIDIYTVSKQKLISHSWPVVHYNNLINRNSKYEQKFGLAIPDVKTINWESYKYIVIEVCVLKLGKSKAKIMQLIIDLKEIPKHNHFEISVLDFKRGYYKIESFSDENFNEYGILDLKNQLIKMTCKEVKDYFDLKNNWKY